MTRTMGRLSRLALGVLLFAAAGARAQDYQLDFSSGFSDPISVGYDSFGAYAYDTTTGTTLTDISTYSAPSVASNWDYASTVPEGGYTTINGVMWPTCYGCTAGMTGAEATSMGVYDAYRQYNSWNLFVQGYGWTDSVYMGTYQGDTSFFVSNNFAYTHDFVVEQYGQSMFNLFTPYCPSVCVATLTNGTLTDATTGQPIANVFGTVYDNRTGAPAVPPPWSGGGGDGN